ncbi:MAG: HAMP domain-containing histidine kinase [candidate division Zixibacteria bacterium]|nr:HAMP domain-containing histidine kinase [candidate division Zixibacteria bacterium]
MGSNLFTRLHRSLFLKILLVFVLAYTVITVVGIMANRSYLRTSHFATIQRNAVNQCAYIIDDLQIPPDTVLAGVLADSFGIQIRIETPDYVWASYSDMPNFDELQLGAYGSNPKTRVDIVKQIGTCVDIFRDYGRFSLVLESEQEQYRARFTMYQIITYSTMFIVILLVFFTIRWLLRPIRTLHEAVRQIGRGNLDYEVCTNRGDELGELVTSFGTMTERIRGMIRTREQLLLDVSHELRSPLTRARVGLEIMEPGPARDGIRDDINEMETMIMEIMETHRLDSRFGALNLQPTNIVDLLREVCAGFADQKPGVKPADLPDEVILDVEPERTVILFKNIIANALKYSDGEGRPVEIAIRRENGEVIVEVRDFGAGIPEKELRYVFEPFYRVDKSRSKQTGGYGLGLSMCRKIMQAHGGDIEISSRVKVGTTVYLKYKTTSGESGNQGNVTIS